MDRVLDMDNNHCFEEDEVKTSTSAGAVPLGSDLSGSAHLSLGEERNQNKSAANTWIRDSFHSSNSYENLVTVI